MAILKGIRVLDKAIMKIMRTIGSVGVFVMTISIILQILSRLVGQSFPWTEELARYIMIWLCFLATAFLFNDPSYGGHIRVDVLVSLFPKYISGSIEFLMNVCVSIFALLGSMWGFQLAMSSMDHFSTALHLPIGVVYLSFPVSMALIVFFSIRKVLEWAFKSKSVSEEK